MTIPHNPKLTILVLGASYAGLSITHYLLKHVLSSLPDHEIVLVGASKEVMCRPACPRAMISDEFFNQKKLFVDVSNQLEQYPKEQWNFVYGAAVHVDHEARIATIKRNDDGSEVDVPFHALVIATGASTSSPLLSNGSDRAATWEIFRATLPSAKSIVIAGGGPTGVEVAGELGEYLNGRSELNITLVTSAAQILPSLRPAIVAIAERYLSKLSVKVIKETKVVTIEPSNAGTEVSALASRTSVTLSTGENLEADIYIPATGTYPNTSFLSPTLLSSSKHVTTNHATLRIDIAGPRIYAIGDCSTAFRPAIHNIMAAVPVLGANIKNDLTESGSEDEVFKEDTRETQLVPIGTKKGVGAAMGWRLPSWVVWMIKGRDYWVWTTGRLWSGKQW